MDSSVIMVIVVVVLIWIISLLIFAGFLRNIITAAIIRAYEQIYQMKEQEKVDNSDDEDVKEYINRLEKS